MMDMNIFTRILHHRDGPMIPCIRCITCPPDRVQAGCGGGRDKSAPTVV